MASVHKIRVFQGTDEQWYYESKAANGQVLSTSEGYTHKDSAMKAAANEFDGQHYMLEVEDSFAREQETDNGN